MYEHSKRDLFLLLNYFCNDQCDFCFFSKFSRSKKFLTLVQVREILEKYKNKISGISLTGGEPTANPYFWEILDYVYCRCLKRKRFKVKSFDVSTNALSSSDKKKALELEKYFKPFDKRYPDIKISFSFPYFDNSPRTKRRISGIKNLMKINSNLEAVVTITRKNISQILSIIHFLLDQFNKRPSDKYFFRVDLRLPYLSEIRGLSEYGKLVAPYGKFFPIINKALDAIQKGKILATLHNIPLCYIGKKYDFLVSRRPSGGIMILPGAGSGYEKKKMISSFGKDRKCLKCRLNDICGGIEKKYIKMFDYMETKFINQ